MRHELTVYGLLGVFVALVVLAILAQFGWLNFAQQPSQATTNGQVSDQAYIDMAKGLPMTKKFLAKYPDAMAVVEKKPDELMVSFIVPLGDGEEGDSETDPKDVTDDAAKPTDASQEPGLWPIAVQPNPELAALPVEPNQVAFKVLINKTTNWPQETVVEYHEGKTFTNETELDQYLSQRSCIAEK